MADFKIKSAAGTGNKTLIQGQDQVDSNYAIQIGDGGASTLHNATITAGTLPIKVKMGVYFFEQGMASGNVSITGVGFQGNYLEAWVNYTGAINSSLRSYGYAKKVGSTITQQCIQFSQNSATAVLTTHFASTSDSTSTEDGAYQKFAFTSFDSDGFTFANTLTSTPSTVHGLTYIVKYYGEMT